MPLCGLKKSKKQKRDHSPVYGETETKPQETNQELQAVENARQDLEKELAIEKREKDNANKEIARLRKEVEGLRKKKNEQKKDTSDGTEMSILALAAPGQVEELQEAKKKVEEITKLKEAAVEEHRKIEEESKVTVKTLETAKSEAEQAKKRLEDELKTAKKTLETERNHRLKTEEEKEKIKREKDTVENTLAHTKKELDIAKKESHIPRSPTKAPSDEWKAKIDAAQSEFEKERSIRIDKEKELTRIISEKEQLVKDKEQLEEQMKATKVSTVSTEAQSDEWKAKIEAAESDIHKERTIRTEKEQELARTLSEKEQLKKDKEQLEEKMKGIQNSSDTVSADIRNKLESTEKNYKNNLQKLEETVTELQKSLSQKESDNETLLDRLSAITAAQVLDNNPNVADLSDPNRPQKLSEQMAQLYDDQWTDATEALEKLNINDDDGPKMLMKILASVYNHCKESAENQLSRIEEDIFLPPFEHQPSQSSENGTEMLKSPTSSKSHSMSKIPRFTSHKGRPALPNLSSEKKTVDVEANGKEKDKGKRSLSFPRVKGEKLPELSVEVKKGIKDYRKKVTKQVIPVIEKEMMKKLLNDPDVGDKVVDACKVYISRCVELCWLMCVQDPPMALFWKVPEDKSFSEDVYRAYTHNGNHVDYVVWPAVYLYEGGPMLTKGVAQGAA